MFLDTRETSHPARKSLDPSRMARTVAGAASPIPVDQVRRIRMGHASFVLGLTIAVAAAVSLGAFESGASPARPENARPATRGITVSKIPAAPLNVVLVDSQAEADLLLAEAYHLQTEASGSVALPTVRVIDSSAAEHFLKVEMSMIGFEGVEYRIADLRAK